MQLINKEVRIENCNVCNANCLTCPREKMTRKQTIMPVAHFKNLVDQAKDLGADTISIFGYGEPLIDKNIAERVQYCTDKGLNTFITTNGSLLKMQLAFDLLKAGLSHIRFSVHGMNHNYEKVHKGLKFNTFQRNFANFAAIRNKRYPFCKISVTAIPQNGESLQYLKDYWKDFDLEIWKPHNWTSGRCYRDLTKERKKSCGRPFNGPVQINADGLMMVCCFDYNAEMIVGDTYKLSIESILKGRAFNFIRFCHSEQRLNGLPCEVCDQLNIGDNPLLYSTIDPSLEIGKTSSTKFKLKEI